ncbi:mucin-2-like isoform X23 [Epinephelus moara]|uniref:mucin-2-like isoform X23 n=1 Tax=Epinephelus moara TaxID=300413 RepID=UPI00214EE684|nr:mucin-2-like isoform X23 [Epinephelus moara]
MKNILSVLLFLTGLFYHASCRPRYHFINEPLAWLKAQRFCRERYTDLATIFDVEDMNRLVNSAQDSTGGFTGMAWIGLHDNLTSWRWSFSDSNYYGDNYYGDNEGDYRNWDFGQPDNFGGNQMCVTMWSGGVWVDSQCFLRNPFICYDGTTGTAQRFIFVEQEMNWTDAQLYCRKRYTDLASVRDEKENEEIQRLAQNRSVWIGFYRTREWSDKSNSTYQYWKNGQPDNVAGQQNCTVTDLGNAGLWLDERCGRELVFICYEDQDQTLQKSTLSTTTAVTQKKMTPTDEESSGDETSNEEVFSTTTTVTRNRITTTERISGTKITSSPQPSGPDMEKTTSIPDQTLQKSTLSTTTTAVTRNKITPTDEESSGDGTSNEEVFSTTIAVTPNRITPTERISGTKIPSSPQPSGPDMEKTTSIPDQTLQKSTLSTTTAVTRKKMTPTDEESSGDETSNEEVFSTTTTVTPNRITTTERNSRTKITSSAQPSGPEVEKTTSIPDKTLQKSTLSTTTTTVTGNKITPTDEESSGDETSNEDVFSTTTTVIRNRITTTEKKSSTKITSSPQPSGPDMEKTTSIPDQTPQVPSPSTTTTTTTTVTPDRITPTETESTSGHFSTEITSVGQPSTHVADQTRPLTNQTPQVPSPSTTTNTTTVTPNTRTTTETKSTTGHFGTEITSVGQPSTTEVDQTRPITNQTLPRPSHSTTIDTSTVTPNKRTTAEIESTTGQFGTEITSDGQPSTTEVDQTRPITMIPNDRSTTEIQPSTGHLSTEITSTGQSSAKEVDQTRAVSNQTPQVPSPSTTTTTTTTVTPNTRTTTETKSTTGHFGTEITSVGQPSTTEVDQTRPITNQTLPRPSHSTTMDTTTVTPNKRTTAEIESTTGQFGTEITSVGQPSTTEVDQTRPITMIPNDRSTTEIQPSTGHLSTEITSTGQSSAKEVDQTRAVSNQTPQVPSPSTTTTTTTVTPNTRTTTETKSTSGHFSTEITSVGQPSTTEVDQTRPITNQTLPRPSHSTTMDTTTVTPNKRTTAEIESTTGQFGTEITSVGQPSTTEVDQTRPITMIPNDRSTTEIQPSTGHLSTEITSTGQSSAKEVDQTRAVSMTPDKRTTTEIKSTTGHASAETTSFGQPSTSHADQTRPITDETPKQPALSTTKMTTMERDSSSTMVSSQQYSTATGDQTNNIPAQHVVALRLKLTSQTPLTEDDIEELVLVQFRNLLIEMGLPTSIKVGVKSTEIMSNKETDTDG